MTTLAGLVLICLVLAAPALASRWVIDPVPGHGILSNISCSSRRSCVAVGAGRGVVRWNGRRWTGELIVRHGIGHQYRAAKALGISCRSARSCMLVGDGAMAETWNGSTWAFHPGLRPPKTKGLLFDSVSCDSGRDCMAVGDFQHIQEGASYPLAEHWNGHAWSLTAPGIVRGSLRDEFDAVSCTSPTACTAVGSREYFRVFAKPHVVYAVPFGEYSFDAIVERWNGHRWSLQRLPRVSGARQLGLSGVACPQVRVCVAVGSATLYSASTGAVGVGIAMRWNGARWSLQRPPGAVTLSGISCLSSTSCTAVGTGAQGTIAERLTGASWSAEATPNPRGEASNELRAVSCVSAVRCFAVGEGAIRGGMTNVPLTEHTI